MDLDQAICDHAVWKTRIKNYIRNNDRSLSATEVVKDDACHLGCWIQGHSGAHAALPAFHGLKSAHTQFHRVAAEIIMRADGGELIDDALAFGATSPFKEKSMEVVEALLQLQKQAKSYQIPWIMTHEPISVARWT